MRIHINIGSNIGNRAAQIERAVALIAACFDPDAKGEIRLAPIIESKPEGYESDRLFLNLGLMIDLPQPLDSHEILRRLQSIEREISDQPHRNADGSYRDRPIDIDLIAVDNLVVETPDLVLPHPRMAERSFVLEPIAILDPNRRHPLTAKTAAEMLECLQH